MKMMKSVRNLIIVLFCIYGCASVPPVFETITTFDEWPNYKKFGQLSAVSVDDSDNVYVFHRSDRQWDATTFYFNDSFINPSQGNIVGTTIVVFSGSGNLLLETGNDRFYLPHGLTVDHNRNLWITDVALHQVFKFPPITSSDGTVSKLADPLLTLGLKLEPGRALNQFCKPTSVAVDKKLGDFFVADGYCNSRIMKFDKQGKFLLKWGRPKHFGSPLPGIYELNLPHSLTIDDKRGILFVADRENSRIVAYNLRNGSFEFNLNFDKPVYGITYSPSTDNIMAVIGSEIGQGVICDVAQKKLTSIFIPPGRGLQRPHDVAVSVDEKHIYVAQLSPHKLLRFTVDRKAASTAKEEVANDHSIVPTKPTPNAPPNSPTISPGNAYMESLTGNHIAVSIVTAVILLSIMAVGCHIYRKQGRTSSYEMQGLILSSDE